MNLSSTHIIKRIFLLIALQCVFFISAPAQSQIGIARKYLLHEKNGAIRAHAAKYLLACKEPACRQMLLDSLDDPFWLVRYRALQSVERSPEWIGLYLEALNDPDDMVWERAVRSLIHIGEPALNAVKKAASDENPFVRQGAVIALAIMGDPVNRALVTLQCAKKRSVDDEIEEIFLRALQDADVNVRRTAIEMSHCFDAPVFIDFLIRHTDDPNANVKRAALRALQDCSDSRILPAALKALKDPEFRRDPYYTLRNHMDRIDTKILAGLLRDPNPEMRDAAFDLINRLPDERMDEHLLGELRANLEDLIGWAMKPRTFFSSSIVQILFDLAENSTDAEFIHKITGALRASASDSVYPIYLEFLTHSRHTVIRRMAAQELWARYRRNDLIPFLYDSDSVVRSYAAWAGARDAAWAGARDKDPRALPVLKELAEDPNQEARSNAFSALEEFMPESFDILASILRRDPEKLTAEDLDSIGMALYSTRGSSSHKQKVASLLSPILESRNPNLALGALNWIYEHDGETARLWLKRFIQSDDPQIKIRAMRIARTDAESMEIVFGVFADETESEEIRTKALEELNSSAFKKSSENRDALLAILKNNNTPDEFKPKIVSLLDFYTYAMVNDPDICELILEREARKNREPQGMFVDELKSGRSPGKCRLGIARNLRKTTDPVVIEKLLEVAADRDPSIRAAIADLFGEIGSSMTLPALEQLLQDPDPDVREKAQAAIASIRMHLDLN